MHSKLKGNIGETAVAHELAKAGYHVFKELGDLSKIDLIAEKDNVLYRIQVKAAKVTNGFVTLNLKKSGPNYRFYYKDNMVDAFAIYCLDTGKVAFISSKEAFENKSAVSLRVDAVKNNQTKGIRFFSDYEKICWN